ncbi:MAG TPA: ATP-binding protein [Vicinamibacterales bacterium]|jgi:signal transduction histidine kinase|nr:ATP-binding protein [Vicinamibacterales bacterium]
MLMPIRPAATMPIARRLARLNMVTSGMALLVAGIALSFYDFVTFRTALLENQSVEARIVGSNTITALTFDDTAAAERTLGALRAEPGVEGAALYRPDGQLFASYVRDGSVAPLVLPAEAAREGEWSRFDGLRTMHLVRPVILDGTPIGLVYIRSNLRAVTDRLVGYGFIVAVVLFVALVASQLVSRVLRRAIADPLTELAGLARKFSADRDYSVRAQEIGSGELQTLISAFNDMLDQIQTRDRSLQESRDQLEERVRERTAALDASNQELEAFCYSVSHDLRSPLRAIDGFSQALLEDMEGRLDADAAGHLARIRAASQRMAALIDDLLSLSRITRTDLAVKRVDLSAMARAVCEELAAAQPGRTVTAVVEDGLDAMADPRLMRQVLENLLGNAWKFTSKQPAARIEFGARPGADGRVYLVGDNGAGFDPAYADRLFGVFQRLHAMTDFPGTGVGLAIVDRIVKRHGGRVWAEAAVGKGATFFFTLS